MSWILLTNDDGPDSPALVPFARAVGQVEDVRVVVPERERSWIGKAITRFHPIDVQPTVRDGVELMIHNGYPADGVQLGIHGLFGTAPRLVLSGINMGYNHGVGFLTSSGTVGAAMEAWVSGLPSIAFSTGSLREWAEWKAHVLSEEALPRWERLAQLCADLCVELEASGILDLADVVSVNIPFEADEKTPRRVTTIARVGYDRLFRPEGEGTFVHDFGGGFLEFDALDGTDVDAAQHGWISVTPIRMPAAAKVPEELRGSLEQ